jgi:hypothetical protein
MTLTSPYLRDTINRRARNFVVLSPLFDLQRNAQLVSNLPLKNFDVLRIVAEVLDAVITEMSGRWGGVSYEDLHEIAGPRLMAASGVAQADVAGILTHVVDALLNQRERDSFRLRYQHEKEDGAVEWREHVFKLLKEEIDETPPHAIRLHATAEAINLHLASLSVDIEATQAAEEAMIHHFVKHGRHREAGMAAKRALDCSVQIRQRLRQLIRAIERQVSKVDYTRDFAPALREARQHLVERLEVETHLMGMVEERLPNANTEDRADLVGARNLIERAYLQHTALGADLMQADKQFLDETQRQRFRRLPSAFLADPWADYARPLLRAKTDDLDEWFRSAPWTLFGVAISRPAHLSALVALMLREPEEEEAVVVTPPVEIVHETGREQFSRDDYEALSELLGSLQTPVTLSEALRQAEVGGASGEVQRLLVLQTSLWFVGTDEDALVVERREAELNTANFYGNDLLLTRR